MGTLVRQTFANKETIAIPRHMLMYTTDVSLFRETKKNKTPK